MKSRYVPQAFDGEGARRYGGRWSSPGTRVVYCSESVSLAALEVLVHLQAAPPLRGYAVIPVHFPERLVTEVPRRDLPKNWASSPAPRRLQQIGDRWASGNRSVVLRVPSAIVPAEGNYLLNPTHPDFGTVEIGQAQPFVLDPRLVRR